MHDDAEIESLEDSVAQARRSGEIDRCRDASGESSGATCA